MKDVDTKGVAAQLDLCKKELLKSNKALLEARELLLEKDRKIAKLQDKLSKRV